MATPDVACRKITFTQGGTSASLSIPTDMATRMNDKDVNDLVTQLTAVLTAVSSSTTVAAGNNYSA